MDSEKTWIKNLEKDLDDLILQPKENLTELTQDRSVWRKMCKQTLRWFLHRKWRRHRRRNGKLFNLGRLQSFTKVKETMIRDFLFADDCALNAGTEQEMHDSMNKFSTACDNFGLMTISIKKTEVMYQSAPGQIYTPPQILVKNNCFLSQKSVLT